VAMAASGAGHIPVMLNPVLAVLAPRDGEIHVDGTFGGGGYARALLDAADCMVIGIDRDPAAIARGHDLARDYPGRLTLIEGPFSAMDDLIAGHGVTAVDGVTLDIGVSSFQLDDATRGFSFRVDGPLDMRMDGTGRDAADVVNELSERELSDLISRLGEERRARAVARAIVAARQSTAITRTGELADIVRSVVRKSADVIDPATRTFQALRLYVNDELGELERGLAAAERILRAGGRLAVVAFHSLEDRIVKRFLHERSGMAARPSRHMPDLPGTARAPSFRLVTRKPMGPGADEIAANPRARSARLRAAVRTEAPAWAAAA
jgi:16S rRNA (cytosine1402-N4)-methyltransferase